MDWENERYVKTYTRDTPNWLALSYDAQCLLLQLFRKVDSLGFLDLGKHGKKGVALALHQVSIWDRLAPALQELLDDGCLELHGNKLSIPNFIDAQESRKSNAQRQRDFKSMRKARLEKAKLPPAGNEPLPPDNKTLEKGNEGNGTGNAVTKPVTLQRRLEETRNPPSPLEGADEVVDSKVDIKAPELIELDRLPDEEYSDRLATERDQFDTCPKIREVLDALGEESHGKIQTTCNTEMSTRLETHVKELGFGIERYKILGKYADPSRGNGFKDLRCALNIAFLLGDSGMRLVNALDNSWAWEQKQRKRAPPVRVREAPPETKEEVAPETLAEARTKLAALKAGVRNAS